MQMLLLELADIYAENLGLLHVKVRVKPQSSAAAQRELQEWLDARTSGFSEESRLCVQIHVRSHMNYHLSWCLTCSCPNITG